MAKHAVAEIVNTAMNEAAEPPEPPRPLYRPLSPAEPYPIDALGELLEQAARAIQARTQAPYALTAQAVLATAALAVQGHADVLLPTGQVRPISLFFVALAESGERKSAVDREALQAVRAHEARLRESRRAERQVWESDCHAWRRARSATEKEHKGDLQALQAALRKLGSSPRAPLLPILTVEEPNWPALFRAFDEGPGALGLFSAEGGAFIGGHGMNDENRLRTATGLSSLWDGEPIRRERGGDGIHILPGRRLSLNLMMQPGVGHRLLGDPMLKDQGLLSRILVVAPETTAGTRRWREPPPEAGIALRTFHEGIKALLEVSPPTFDERNELRPRVLRLSPRARDLWIMTSNAIEDRLGPGGELEPVRAFAAKGAEHAARIAAVLALVDDLEAKEIDARFMVAGSRLVEHYLSEALRLHAAGRVAEHLRRARRLLDWLQRRTDDLVSVPLIYQKGPNEFRDAKVARAAVDVLVEHGHLISVGPGTVDSVKSRETWRLRRE